MTRWLAASVRSACQKAFSCTSSAAIGVAVVVPLHAGVAVGAEPAEEPVVGDAELGHRRVQLAAPVQAEPVLLVGGEVLELGHQDLAHLPGGAGHQRHAAALGDVLRHGRALADRLVVRVRVNQEQSVCRGVAHVHERNDGAHAPRSSASDVPASPSSPSRSDPFRLRAVRPRVDARRRRSSTSLPTPSRSRSATARRREAARHRRHRPAGHQRRRPRRATRRVR